MKSRLITVLPLVLSLMAAPAWAEDEDTAAATAAKAVYYTIQEPFTINFLTQSQQKVRYLQIKVALMSHDQATVDSAEQNLPMIQDGLRNLFTDQSLQNVSTVDGRQALQTQALNTVNRILKQETGKDDIEAVYFTSFILQ